MPKTPRMTDIPLSDRPREKLWKKGATHLSDKELIAILLGSGMRKKNALSLAGQIIRSIPNLSSLPTSNISALTCIPGVGKTKASRILAAIELGFRLFSPQSLQKTYIHTTQDAVKQVSSIAEKHQEYLIVLYLNARHEVIQKEIVSIGNLNTVQIEPRSIFAPAITSTCAECIMAHNHPSGDPTPSEDDIRFTARIQHAGSILGITLIDHIIISRSAYFSMKEKGIVDIFEK